MPAPKGNSYRLFAEGFSKPKKYTPQNPWAKALDYFLWNEDHPLKEQKAFGSGLKITVNKMRAMSIQGFCNYAGISRDTFNAYEKDEAYSDICTPIKQIIYQQKFEGAAADLLNPSIIPREIGLADKRELTGKDGGSIETTFQVDLANLSKEELNLLIKIKRDLLGKELS